MAASRWIGLARAVVVAALWLALVRWLPVYGVYLVPRSLHGVLTLQTYLMAVQVATTAVGLGLGALLLADARADLGLRRPTGWQAAATVLVTPAVFVATSWIALRIALPTLLEELARGGAEATRQNAGEFGRALKQTPAWITLVWASVFAPVAEELLFRGAIWSAFRRLTAPPGPAPRPPVGSRDAENADLPAGLPRRSAGARAIDAGARFLLDGGIATIATAAVFAWMHADLRGGVGIVRVAATACLGLACGLARQRTGGVLAPILLHLTFNALSIGHVRRWLVTESLPVKDGVPTLVAVVAAGCLAILGIAWAVRTRAATRARDA